MAATGALARALSHRDARIFFGGSAIAWTGLWVHRIAVSWYAWQLTGSAFWVGMVAFCDLAPAVVFSPIAGAVADRMDRVRPTMLGQVAIGAQAIAIAGLIAADAMTIGILLVLEVLGGIAASFLQPARQSLMPGLVPRADLPAAVACNSLCFNIARFLGPAIAGPLIVAYGVVPPIALNALAYGVATLSMPLLRVAPDQRRGHAPEASVWREAAAGIRYAATHPGLGPLLLYAGLGSILLRGVQEILPPYVERLFGQGPEGLALLTAAIGGGALAAGLWVANRGRLGGTSRLAVFSLAAQAVATIGFVATGHFAFACTCAVLVGAAGSVHGIAVQTLVQGAADPAMRGRCLAVWGMIVRACPALGAIVLGAAGEAFGLRWPTLIAMGLTLALFGWGLTQLGRMATVLEGRATGAP